MERAKEKTEALLALWHVKRGIRAIPSRDDFSVSALRPWLGNLALVDLRGETPHFRLCGTSLHIRFGGEMTKREVVSLGDGLGRREFLASIEKARQTLIPAAIVQVIHCHHISIAFQELCLPLGQDGRTADTVLFVSYSEKAT